jgi:hypothetical protein
LGLGLACTSDPEAEADADTDADSSESQGSEDESGSGEGEGDGDGDGDAELPVPEDLPTPTGTCPSFVSGDVEFAPEGIEPRNAKVWVGDDPTPPEDGGLLIIYWHAYGSAPPEAEYTFSAPVMQAILDAGGVVVAPYSSPDAGTFEWFAVNGSDAQDDMLVGDEIVACAIQELGIDPRRIHVTGMSAGGLQTTAFTMARSRYVASAATFSGGAFVSLDFEDPSNPFAAMIIHGGDNDLFGGTVNFKELSTAWYNQLTNNGHFAFMCDHGQGHTIPAGYGPGVANFFFAHPFGTDPSPYAEALPAELPDDCSL